MMPGYHYMQFYHWSYAVNQWLANQGYVVLSVNYRSGIGYGRSFRQAANTNARGNSEYQDVLAAGKYLQARADVDPARVGIWGLSYGGLLTSQALARNSDIFVAGADLAGVHLYGSSLDTASMSYKSSAISAIDSWKSPVFLVHGDDDRNVDFAQTVGLVQLLRARGIYYELRSSRTTCTSRCCTGTGSARSAEWAISCTGSCGIRSRPQRRTAANRENGRLGSVVAGSWSLVERPNPRDASQREWHPEGFVVSTSSSPSTRSQLRRLACTFVPAIYTPRTDAEPAAWRHPAQRLRDRPAASRRRGSATGRAGPGTGVGRDSQGRVGRRGRVGAARVVPLPSAVGAALLVRRPRIARVRRAALGARGAVGHALRGVRRTGRRPRHLGARCPHAMPPPCRRRRRRRAERERHLRPRLGIPRRLPLNGGTDDEQG